MKNQGRYLLATGLLASVMVITGCLEIKGEQEVPTSDLNNSDFSVTAPDGSSGSTQSGGRPTTPTTDSGTSDSGQLPPDVSTDLPAGFTINRGALMTGSQDLLLAFNPPFTSAFMKVSESSDCSGGSWGGYADSIIYSAQLVNQSVPISVQFKDYDGRVSLCFKNSIIIDKAGPSIVFQKYPAASIEEGLDVEIVFNVEDAAGVKSVQCQFAGVLKTCLAGSNKVVFPKMAAGSYQFNVLAEDSFGNKSQRAIVFQVTSLYKNMKQSVTVTQNNKVDILFVIDNSGSMAYEQKSMASRVRNFLDVIKGLDWQAAVTTTDPSNSTYGDGRLVSMKGLSNTYILKSSMDEATSRTVLSNTLQRSETGSGSEQGIYATYRTIERSLAGPGIYKDFIREGAQLAVVEISDEDESANGLKNDPSNLIKLIQSSFNGQKAFSFHSIIARPGDTKCLSGEGATAGFRLEQMSKLTGGMVGDVCALDYAEQMKGIADGVRKTLKTLTLSCEPVVDSYRNIIILKDGLAYTGTYVKSGVNLTFNDMLPSGNYEVLYTCVR